MYVMIRLGQGEEGTVPQADQDPAFDDLHRHLSLVSGFAGCATVVDRHLGYMARIPCDGSLQIVGDQQQCRRLAEDA